MWRTNSIQLVWFFDKEVEAQATTIYEKLIGLRPKSTQTDTIQTPAEIEVSSASGDNTACSYRVQTQPGRVDLFILPAGQPLSLSVGPPTFHDPKAAVEAISNKTSSVVHLWPNPVRLACVIQNSQTATSAEDAIENFKRLVDMEKLPLSCRDVNFSANFKQNSKSNSNIVFNRIARWATATFQQINIPSGLQPSQPGGTITLPQNAITLLPAFTLEADVNTANPSVTFNETLQQSIMSELVSEALRLSSVDSLEAVFANE